MGIHSDVINLKINQIRRKCPRIIIKVLPKYLTDRIFVTHSSSSHLLKCSINFIQLNGIVRMYLCKFVNYINSICFHKYKSCWLSENVHHTIVSVLIKSLTLYQRRFIYIWTPNIFKTILTKIIRVLGFFFIIYLMIGMKKEKV